MAEVERWITVNGVHIPIMKGESKARAVSRFIKDRVEKKKFGGDGYGSKRAIDKLRKTAKESEDAWRKTPDTDDRKERNALLTSKQSAAIKAEKDKEQFDQALAYRRSLNRDIKGYSSKVKDADKAYKEKWNELTPNVEKARENYEKSKLRDLDPDKQTYGDHIRGEYSKTRKSKEDLADYHNRMAQYELSRKNLTSSLRRQYENAEEGRELAALNAHRDTLARIPNAYKFKGDNNKFVNKSTIAAMKKDIRNKSDYALGELIYGIEKTADNRGYRISGNRKRGLTEYEKKYQDLARAEMRLRRRKNK